MPSDAVKGLVFFNKNRVPQRELFFFTHSKCKSIKLYNVRLHLDIGGCVRLWEDNATFWMTQNQPKEKLLT